MLLTIFLCTSGIAQDTLYVAIPDSGTGKLVLLLADDLVKMVPPGAVPDAANVPAYPCTASNLPAADVACIRAYVTRLRDTLMVLDTFNARQYAFNANVYLGQLEASARLGAPEPSPALDWPSWWLVVAVSLTLTVLAAVWWRVR